MRHALLKQARKAAALLLHGFAERMGMAHAVFKNSEVRLAALSSDMLRIPSQAQSVRAAYFFRAYTAVVEPLECHIALNNLFRHPPKAFVAPSVLLRI